jgi:hypothetical protein
MKARDELRMWLDATGRKQVEVAESIGVGKTPFHRLLFGRGTLDGSKLEMLERLTAIPGLAVRLAQEGPRAGKAGLRKASAKVVRLAPAGPPVADEAPPTMPEAFDPALPGKLAVVAGQPDAAPLFQAMLKLAFTARSEGVRRAAADSLLDRLCGKAVQKVLDLTPKPPAENAELLLVLHQLAGEAVPDAPEDAREAPTPAEPLLA